MMVQMSSARAFPPVTLKASRNTEPSVSSYQCWCQTVNECHPAPVSNHERSPMTPGRPDLDLCPLSPLPTYTPLSDTPPSFQVLRKGCFLIIHSWKYSVPNSPLASCRLECQLCICEGMSCLILMSSITSPHPLLCL